MMSSRSHPHLISRIMHIMLPFFDLFPVQFSGLHRKQPVPSLSLSPSLRAALHDRRLAQRQVTNPCHVQK